jgi:glycerol-3-phosphate dehydrogenase (NAD(P)+)
VTIKTISVYGAGSWGTALALQLARNGLEVLLWDINPEQIKNLNTARENSRYLPNIAFPANLNGSSHIADLLQHADYQLIVVPSHGFRQLLAKIKPLIKAHHVVIWATKGLEVNSGKLLHQVLQEELPAIKQYGVISGPTFAGEVAKGLPTAMTAAAVQQSVAEQIGQAFTADNFRVYTSTDIIGVELGGAIKNILAIAAGISDGLGFGANARTALITRGLAEMIRLGQAMGAQAETLMGLAGVGDLVLTCTDNQSRNRRLGLALGQGKDLDTAIAEIGQAVEGAKSSQAIGLLAAKVGIEMPICQHVHQILYQNLSAHDAVHSLINRKIKPEF